MSDLCIEAARLTLTVTEWFAIFFFLALNGGYALLLVGATLEMLRHYRETFDRPNDRLLASPLGPTISVIAPAFNEETTIVESLNSLFGLHYPNVEIVVVNDGSKDATLEVLRDEFGLVPIHTIFRRRITTQRIRCIYRSHAHPRLIVVDKDNGGRADAVNAALNVATADLACVIDADTLLEPDALQRMVRPFLNSPDVLGVGATIRIANGSVVRGGRVIEARVPSDLLSGFQVVEYLRAFLFGRLGWNRLGGNLIISGAFGLFRRESLIEAGGLCHDTIGEDFELVMKLRVRAYERGGSSRIVFVPDPIAWTEAPATLGSLGRQRDRWHRGLADVVFRYRYVLFNPRYRAMGLYVFPHYAILELLAPVVEGAGLIALPLAAALGLLNVEFALLFFLAVYGFGAALTLSTLLLEEFTFCRYRRVRDRLRLVGFALFEGLGYRQLTVFWRLRGLVKLLRGDHGWGAMDRRGFQPTRSGAVFAPGSQGMSA